MAATRPGDGAGGLGPTGMVGDPLDDRGEVGALGEDRGAFDRLAAIGPAPAVREALERAGLKLADVDLFELNEGFGAQSLAVLRELDIAAPTDKPARAKGTEHGHDTPRSAGHRIRG